MYSNLAFGFTIGVRCPGERNVSGCRRDLLYVPPAHSCYQSDAPR